LSRSGYIRYLTYLKNCGAAFPPGKYSCLNTYKNADYNTGGERFRRKNRIRREQERRGGR
jgi:hypothetical protein